MISGAACAAKSESSVQTLRAGRCASSGPVAAFMPADRKPAHIDKKTYYGGLYQKLVLTC